MAAEARGVTEVFQGELSGKERGLRTAQGTLAFGRYIEAEQPCGEADSEGMGR